MRGRGVRRGVWAFGLGAVRRLVAAATAVVVAVALAIVVTPPAVAATPSVSQGAAKQLVKERPDPVSASLQARLQGSRVEVSSLRSETSRTFANPEGAFTDEVSSGPVRYRDAGGAWHDVDMSLVKQPDGSLAPRGSAIGLRLSGAGGAPGSERDLVSTTRDGQAVTVRWGCWLGCFGRRFAAARASRCSPNRTVRPRLSMARVPGW